jgi:ribosomal protein S18 acetylase RimI-like enzyme
MLSIPLAASAEDFEIAADYSRIFGEWDAMQAAAYGVPPDMIMDMFHGDDAEQLLTRFTIESAHLFVARWGGKPAGTVGFEPFGDDAFELQKFYVDPAFRGKRIGRELILAALSKAEAGRREKIFLQTTIYMNHAVELYQAHGFSRCAPFRPLPQVLERTEVFMARPLGKALSTAG